MNGAAFFQAFAEPGVTYQAALPNREGEPNQAGAGLERALDFLECSLWIAKQVQGAGANGENEHRYRVDAAKEGRFGGGPGEIDRPDMGLQPFQPAEQAKIDRRIAR